MQSHRFSTNLTYTSRKDKPRYVSDKYSDILQGSVLDVGADNAILKRYLRDATSYVSIGLGPGVDKKIDLEEGDVPYNDDEFDCVLCLEVLEHLDNMHQLFDELCRVAESYVIVSLPNPWASFMRMLRYGYYDGDRRPIKYYYLPTDPPVDRHKWFFAPYEAKRFIKERAVMNGFEIIQIDQEWSIDSTLFRSVLSVMLRLVIHRDVQPENLFLANTWGVIKCK
jgi:hypothetical protein